MRTIIEFLAKFLGYDNGSKNARLSAATGDGFSERERGLGSASLAPRGDSSNKQHQQQTVPSDGNGPLTPTCDQRARSRDETLAAITAIDFVPALRHTTENVRRLIARSGVSLEEIVAAIAQDSFLSFSVLRAANALVSASGAGVAALSTAVQILGVLRLEEILQAHMQMHDGLISPLDLEHRRQGIHSLAVGMISEKLSKLLNVGDPSRLYFAGLWHDAGKRVLSHIFPDAYHKAVSLASTEGACLETIERQFFGMSHSEAGMIYADQCGVGPLVLQAIAHHASPENAQLHRGGTAVVGIASFLARAAGLGYGVHSSNGAGAAESLFTELSAWTVLTAETGRKQDLPNLYRSLQPVLQSLDSELETIHKSL